MSYKKLIIMNIGFQGTVKCIKRQLRLLNN